MRKLVLISLALASALCVSIAAAPMRLFEFARTIFVGFVDDARAFVGLFVEVPLAADGPSDTSIDGTLFQRNRHEAGLARLGAARHR